MLKTVFAVLQPEQIREVLANIEKAAFRAGEQSKIAEFRKCLDLED
jgi:hypothetical protein